MTKASSSRPAGRRQNYWCCPELVNAPLSVVRRVEIGEIVRRATKPAAGIEHRLHHEPGLARRAPAVGVDTPSASTEPHTWPWPSGSSFRPGHRAHRALTRFLNAGCSSSWIRRIHVGPTRFSFAQRPAFRPVGRGIPQRAVGEFAGDRPVPHIVQRGDVVQAPRLHRSTCSGNTFTCSAVGCAGRRSFAAFAGPSVAVGTTSTVIACHQPPSDSRTAASADTPPAQPGPCPAASGHLDRWMRSAKSTNNGAHLLVRCQEVADVGIARHGLRDLCPHLASAAAATVQQFALSYDDVVRFFASRCSATGGQRSQSRADWW